MKKYSWMLVVAAMAPLVPLACGGGSTSSTSSGGTGGTPGAGGSTATTGTNTTGTNTTGTTTTGSNTTASATGTGGGAPVDCTTVFPQGPCDTCGQANCCAEGSACNDVAGCVDCLGDPTLCDASNQAAHDALITCLQASCQAECFPPPCNPVTGAGCDVASGWTCDREAMSGAFTCFAPPNDAKLCGACDNGPGPYCGAGMGCLAKECARYCCADADCGTGKCDKTLVGDGTSGVGLCVTTADNMKPACDAPATSPSMGSCFGGMAGTGSSSGTGP